MPRLVVILAATLTLIAAAGLAACWGAAKGAT